jgi:transposase-like protein
MINKDFNSIIELLKAFPNEQICTEHLVKLRWNDNIISPFDASSKVYKCKNNRYKCKNSGKYFNVKTNTIFDNTKMPLQKWFLAIWLVTSHKKGISSLQLGRDLDITQKSAWFMLQRIRNCFGIDNDQLEGEVEIDETYIGGKAKNRKESIRADKSFEMKDRYRKSTVMGMVQRDGLLVAKHIGNSSERCLLPPIMENVSNEAKIYTDQHKSYSKLNRIYDHKTVKHNQGEYVRGRVHTNRIEGFWSILKRGIFGIYHFTSRKHLHYYVDEFVFRYNTRDRNDSTRFNLLLTNTENRLTYKELIA